MGIAISPCAQVPSSSGSWNSDFPTQRLFVDSLLLGIYRIGRSCSSSLKCISVKSRRNGFYYRFTDSPSRSSAMPFLASSSMPGAKPSSSPVYAASRNSILYHG